MSTSDFDPLEHSREKVRKLELKVVGLERHRDQLERILMMVVEGAGFEGEQRWEYLNALCGIDESISLLIARKETGQTYANHHLAV